MLRHKMIKDVGPLVLIIIGMLLIIYPIAKGFYHDARQKTILESYLNSMANVENITIDSEDEAIGAQEEDALEPGIKDEGERPVEAQNEGEEEKQEVDISEKWPVESILEIPKIDLMMPILTGATKEHLNISAASIEYTGKPWDGGNYAVAGHSSQRQGKHFGRLTELGVGDEILVRDKKKHQYKYQVFDVKVVKETDMTVLESTEQKELTLITCYPVYIQNPPTRLIIKARQVN